MQTYGMTLLRGCVGVVVAGLIGMTPVLSSDVAAAAAVPTFAMIGDSITWQATAELEKAIPGIRVDGVIGRSFAQANDALDAMLSGGVPDVLIVGMGTNPTMTLTQVDDFMSRTTAIRRVVFVNIRIPRTWESPTNDLINSLPQRYAKVSVVDWYGYSATRSQLINTSGFHLTDAGKPTYAALVAEGAYRAAACGDTEPGGSDGCDPNGAFIDDDWSEFEADIEWMASGGITKGCNPPVNDRFCPDGVVTRGQMAAFLVRALGLTDRLDNPFTDDDGSIFEADIERLAGAGITKGCNPPVNDRFCPDGKVTRGQIAAFLVRAMGYSDPGGGDLFVDDDDSLFEADIDRLATAGVTKGCNPPVNDRFCPSGYMTRGQMAAFLHRALG